MNNDLSHQMKEKMNGDTFKEFLLHKYGWTDRIFNQIAWIAHQRQLHKVPMGHRVTLLKYLHGWLATKQRKFWEGLFKDSLCPLYGEDETRAHIFICRSEKMKAICQHRRRKFLQDIGDITIIGSQQVFEAGLSMVVGVEVPSGALRRSWPPDLQKVHEAQEEVG